MAAGALSLVAAVLHPIPETTATLSHGRNTAAHILIGLVIVLVALFALTVETTALTWQRVAGAAVGAAGGIAVASAAAVGQVAQSDTALAHDIETSPQGATVAILIALALVAVVSLAAALWGAPALPRPAVVLIVLGVIASETTGNPGSALLAVGLLWCAVRVRGARGS